jgi:hypothetical protein
MLFSNLMLGNTEKDMHRENIMFLRYLKALEVHVSFPERTRARFWAHRSESILWRVL